MAKVVWTNPALMDLHQIYRYLAKSSQSESLAERICDEIMDFAKGQLETFPNAGAIVEEASDYGAREVYKHGYRIIYVLLDDGCYIVRCVHSTRELARELNPTDWPLTDR